MPSHCGSQVWVPDTPAPAQQPGTGLALGCAEELNVDDLSTWSKAPSTKTRGKVCTDAAMREGCAR